jgi:hypothetical protein
VNTDVSFGIRQLTKKNWEYGKELVIHSSIIKKVSDSTRREEIWKSLKKLGVSKGLFRKVKNTYETTINCVKTSKG